MDCQKIGKFISECRKDKCLTQEQLGALLGISDRAISKWERGLNMPDVSLFEPLCKKLDISINELISGERLNNDDYKKMAEQNLIVLFLDRKKCLLLKIVAEILIVFGILIMLSLPDILKMTLIQNIVVRVVGIFIFLCGTILEYYIKKITDKRNQ